MKIDKLKELKEKSTKVVAWYPHPREVRGPFGRWFTCSGGDNGMGDPVKYPTPVAPIEDDCAYAAAAMNAVPNLIKQIECMENALKAIVRSRGDGDFPLTVAYTALEILQSIREETE